MSAFLVKEETINTIVCMLSEYSADSHSLQDTARALKIDITSPHWQARLAQALFELNCEALHQRYGDTEFPLFHYRFIQSQSLMKSYKALKCYLYQAREGDVPQRNLYKFMEKFSHFLAHQIVINLPEFEKAEWG